MNNYAIRNNRPIYLSPNIGRTRERAVKGNITHLAATDRKYTTLKLFFIEFIIYLCQYLGLQQEYTLYI